MLCLVLLCLICVFNVNDPSWSTVQTFSSGRTHFYDALRLPSIQMVYRCKVLNMKYMPNVERNIPQTVRHITRNLLRLFDQKIRKSTTSYGKTRWKDEIVLGKKHAMYKLILCIWLYVELSGFTQVCRPGSEQLNYRNNM